MASKLLFLVNPHAGKGQIKNHLCDVVDIFIKHGYDVTIRTTQARDDARAVAAERCGEFDLIVCSGGDGTLSEVVNGVMSHEGPKPAIGYLPMGSTNDFGKTLGIPAGIDRAATMAVTAPAYACDVGRFNGKCFTYSAAFGLFSDVSYATPQRTKNLLGHAAYILQGIESLSALRSFHVTVKYDGHTVTDDYLLGMVTNSDSVGGFRGICGQDVLLADGQFEVVLIRMPKSILELNNVVISMLAHNLNTNGILAFRSSSLEFISEEPLAWTLDGEYGGSPRDAKIEIEKKAVRYVTRMGRRG